MSLGGRPGRRWIWLAAAGLIALAGAVLALRLREAPPELPAFARLVGVVGGKFHGRPFIARRAEPREQLRPGEVLLLRFRLAEPASVHLTLRGSKATRSLWTDGRPDTEPAPGLLPRGEHALVTNKEVFPVRPEEFGGPITVTLVASPEPFPAALVPRLARLGDDPGALFRACPRCSRDVLEVLAPAPGVLPPPEWRWDAPPDAGR